MSGMEHTAISDRGILLNEKLLGVGVFVKYILEIGHMELLFVLLFFP